MAGAALGPFSVQAAATTWDQLGLRQVLVGEWPLEPAPGRTIRAEVRTTNTDDPCLTELLRVADGLAAAASHDWLLLVSPQALLTDAFCANLAQLCRPGSPRRLLIGRAWALPQPPANAADLPAAIEAEGVLDPAARPAWALLPRGLLQAAPAQLGCAPEQAVPWLIRAALQLGWPVLEATSAAPLARPASAPASAPVSAPLCAAHPQATASATGVVLPHRPGAPLLSLLLAAPQAELEPLRQLLTPAPHLPWEVIARPAEPGDGAGAIAAAWNSGLQSAQAELVWPLTAALPPLALIPALLRAFEGPGVDLLQLGWAGQPGGLALQTAWWRRLGGLRDDIALSPALLELLTRARQRGAQALSLPLLPVG